jgi:N-acetylmuramic acid 6-phosphate etherase
VTKVALNILTTVSMVLLGKVKDGRMVDMRATNAKLRDRAVRSVQEALGISEEEATKRLEACGWSIRDAVEK